MKIRLTKKFIPTWYRSETSCEVVIQLFFVMIMICWHKPEGEIDWLDD